MRITNDDATAITQNADNDSSAPPASETICDNGIENSLAPPPGASAGVEQEQEDVENIIQFSDGISLQIQPNLDAARAPVYQLLVEDFSAIEKMENPNGFKLYTTHNNAELIYLTDGGIYVDTGMGDPQAIEEVIEQNLVQQGVNTEYFELDIILATNDEAALNVDGRDQLAPFLIAERYGESLDQSDLQHALADDLLERLSFMLGDIDLDALMDDAPDALAQTVESDLVKMLETVYGDEIYDDSGLLSENAITLLNNIGNQEIAWLPQPEFVTAQTLENNHGAFGVDDDGTPRIIINEDLSLEAKRETYWEEMGHFFDVALFGDAGAYGSVDSVGDEGALFRAALSGVLYNPDGSVNQAVNQEILADVDYGQITLEDGRVLDVEFMASGNNPEALIDKATKSIYTASNTKQAKANTVKGSVNQLAAANISYEQAVQTYGLNSPEAVAAEAARNAAYNKLDDSLNILDVEIRTLEQRGDLTPQQQRQVALMRQYHYLSTDLGEYFLLKDEWPDAEQVRKRGLFVDAWNAYLTNAGASDAPTVFKNKMANAQKPFTSVFNGVPNEELTGYVDVPLPTDEIDPARIHAQTQARLYIGTAVEAQILQNEGHDINTAYARAQVFVDGLPVISDLYTNTPESGAPYKEGDFTKSASAGDKLPTGLAEDEQWGEVILVKGNKRVNITNAVKYADWLAQSHFEGKMHPYVRERIIGTVNHANSANNSINLPQDIHNLNLPGTHAEIKAFNDAVRQVRETRIEDGLPDIDWKGNNGALDSVTVSTFDFYGGRTGKPNLLRGQGQGFHACNNCSAIIPPRVNVLSGATESRILPDPLTSTSTKRDRYVDPNEFDADALVPGAKRHAGAGGDRYAIGHETVVEAYPDNVELETLYADDRPVYAAERKDGKLVAEAFYDENGEASRYVVYETLTEEQLDQELYDGEKGPVTPAGDYQKATAFQRGTNGEFARTDAFVVVDGSRLVQSTAFDADTGRPTARNRYDLESGDLFNRTEYHPNGKVMREGGFKEVARPGAGMGSGVVDWSYEWNGEVTEYDAGESPTARKKYDAYGNLLTHVDAQGNSLLSFPSRLISLEDGTSLTLPLDSESAQPYRHYHVDSDGITWGSNSDGAFSPQSGWTSFGDVETGMTPRSRTTIESGKVARQEFNGPYGQPLYDIVWSDYTNNVPPPWTVTQKRLAARYDYPSDATTRAGLQPTLVTERHYGAADDDWYFMEKHHDSDGGWDATYHINHPTRDRMEFTYRADGTRARKAYRNTETGWGKEWIIGGDGKTVAATNFYTDNKLTKTTTNATITEFEYYSGSGDLKTKTITAKNGNSYSWHNHPVEHGKKFQGRHDKTIIQYAPGGDVPGMGGPVVTSKTSIYGTRVNAYEPRLAPLAFHYLPKPGTNDLYIHQAVLKNINGTLELRPQRHRKACTFPRSGNGNV